MDISANLFLLISAPSSTSETQPAIATADKDVTKQHYTIFLWVALVEYSQRAFTRS